jgi:hypothetical protein
MKYNPSDLLKTRTRVPIRISGLIKKLYQATKPFGMVSGCFLLESYGESSVILPLALNLEDLLACFVRQRQQTETPVINDGT